MSIDEVNQRGTWITTVDFTNEDGDAVTPTAAVYRIDDIGSGTVVRGNTAIESLSSSIEITWSATDTAILDESHAYETRRLTVFYDYSTGKHGSPKQYFLNVINLFGITSTSPA